MILFCMIDVCEFEDFQVKSVLLEGVMRTPEIPIKDAIVQLETKALRDLKSI